MLSYTFPTLRAYRAAFLLLATSLVAGCGGAAPARYTVAPPLAMSWALGTHTQIVWLQPKRIKGPRLPGAAIARRLSPDGRFVAFGLDDDSIVVLDLVHRRLGARIRPWGHHRFESCGVTPIAWPDRDRLVATLWCGWAHGTTNSSLAVIDPVTGSTLSTRRLGSVAAVVALPHRGALVLAGPVGRRIESFPRVIAERVGLSRLIRVDRRGVAVRALRIESGLNANQTRIVAPALVYDAGHAYVLSETDGVADVDLGTLAVAYHRLSLAAQPMRAGVAYAHEGTANPAREIERVARRLDHGRILVTGYDIWTHAGHDRWAPAGLRLIDLTSWSSRLLDARPSAIVAVSRRRAKVNYRRLSPATLTIELPQK